MDYDYSYLFDLGPLQHQPMRPPRPNHVGEEVFASAWETLMASPVDHWGDPDGSGAPNSRLAMILHHLPERLIQRHATVAASLVTWFCTNCGGSFIQLARSYASTCKLTDPWLCAWADENKRRNWLNSGFRTLEHCLAPEDHMGKGGLARIPELSAMDFEVAEHVVSWFGAHGAEFLGRCQEKIAARQAEENRLDRLRLLRINPEVFR